MDLLNRVEITEDRQPEPGYKDTIVVNMDPQVINLDPSEAVDTDNHAFEHSRSYPPKEADGGSTIALCRSKSSSPLKQADGDTIALS